MRRCIRGSLSVLLLLAAGVASAQDGYFSTAVLPLAVDSASFTQAFTFDTWNAAPATTVHVTFFPGQGTPQAAIGPVACNDVVLLALDGTTVPSLRDLCPGLAAQNVFGFLSLQAAGSADDTYDDLPLFAVRSRISNPQGAGFNVDAVAAATFGSGQSRVTGLRRLAASDGAPAYQSNCFVGNLNQLKAGGNPAAKRVNYRLTYAASGIQPIMPFPVFTGYVDVAPGQLVRLLDVFSAAGAPQGGDFAEYMIDFTPAGNAVRPGIFTFCTVQDNTSFQADLRLGKIGYGAQGHAAEEPTMARDQFWKSDLLHAFAIPAGAASNTHLVYFRAPDTIKCELLSSDWTTPQVARLAPAYGLELRLLDSTGLVLGGGSNATSTGQLFLGERGTFASAGMDGRYRVEVESNGQNTGAVRSYSLYCTSGSGHTGGYDIVKFQEPVDRF